MVKIILTISLITFPYIGICCSCLNFEDYYNELKINSDYILIGRPVSNNSLGESANNLMNIDKAETDVIFEVDSVIKGNALKNEKLFIYQFGGSCNRLFKFNTSYIIFANAITQINLIDEISGDKTDINITPPPDLYSDTLNILKTPQNIVVFDFLNEQLNKYKIITTDLCASFSSDSNEYTYIRKNY